MNDNKLMANLANFLILLPILWIFTGLFHFDNGDKILVILTLISALASAIKYNKAIIIDNLKSRYIWIMYGLLLISVMADALHLYNPINLRAIAIICVLLTFFPYQLVTRKTLILAIFLGCINSLFFVCKFTYLTPVARYYWPINAIPFATYICFIAAITFVLLLTSRTIKEKTILVLTLAISIISIALTETRGALVALLPTLLAIYFYFSHQRKTLKRNIIISIFIVGLTSVALYPIVKERIIQTHQEITQIDDGNTDTSIGLRLNFWKAGVHLIEKSPFIGYGENYFSQLDLLAKEKVIIPAAASYKPPHFHNQFIDITVKCGLIGLTTLLFIVLVPIKLINNKSSNDALITYSLISILILSGLTDVPFFHKQIFIIFFISIGILIGKDRCNKIKKGL